MLTVLCSVRKMSAIHGERKYCKDTYHYNAIMAVTDAWRASLAHIKLPVAPQAFKTRTVELLRRQRRMPCFCMAVKCLSFYLSIFLSICVLK